MFLFDLGRSALGYVRLERTFAHGAAKALFVPHCGPYRKVLQVSGLSLKRGRSHQRRRRDRDASLRDRALVGPKRGLPEPRPPALPAACAPLPVSCGAGRAAAAWSVRGPGLGPAGDGRWRRSLHRRRPTSRGVRTSRTPPSVAPVDRPPSGIRRCATNAARSGVSSGSSVRGIACPSSEPVAARSNLTGRPAGGAFASLTNDKYGFHPCGADPPHFPLPPSVRPVLFWPCDRLTDDEQAMPPRVRP